MDNSRNKEKAVALVAILRSLIRGSRRQLRNRVNKDLASLSRNELEALISIAEEDVITMSRLADQIVLSTSSATLIINKLLDKKLVIREHSSDDRRVVRIRLTPRGKALYNAFNADVLQQVHKALDVLDENEQALLISLYAKIADRLLGNS